MSQKYHLHQLIRSLSVSEKGYFKKYVGKFSANQSYLQLFDAIDHQQEYDEDALKEQFSDKGFIRQFSVAKNYLLKSILKSLRAYHSDSSKYFSISEQLQEVELLFLKGLIDLCNKHLKKVKKLVLKTEYFQAYADIASWELKLLSLSPNSNQKAEKIEEIIKLMELGQTGLEEHNALFLILHQLRKLYSHQLSEEEFARDYQIIIAHPLVKHPNAVQTRKALALHYQVNIELEEKKGNFERCFEFSHQLAQQVALYPEIFSNQFFDIKINAFYQLARFASLRGEKGIFKENIYRLESYAMKFTASSETDIRWLRLLILNLNLQNDFINRDFTLIKSRVKQYRKINTLSENHDFYRMKQKLHFWIASAYFFSGQYQNALEWVSLLFEKDMVPNDRDLKLNTKFLYLIIHFTLNNHQYFANKVKSHQGILLSEDKAFILEKITIALFRELAKKGQKKNEQLSKNLKAFSQFNSNDLPIVYQVLIEWMLTYTPFKKYLLNA